MKVLTKYKWIERLTRREGVFLAYNDGKDGGGFFRENGRMQESIDFIMEQSDQARDFILSAACRYLRKYEIQKQEFAKQLYNNEL